MAWDDTKRTGEKFTAAEYNALVTEIKNRPTMDDVGTLQSMMPVGIKWDTSSSSPTLTQIDINGNTITPSTSFFDNHAIWGNIWRCVIDPATGEVTYGSNARGDGLDLTGASGNVMVSIPRFHAKFYADDRYRMYWLSPTQLAGFEEFPSHVMRGGVSKDRIPHSNYNQPPGKHP